MRRNSFIRNAVASVLVLALCGCAGPQAAQVDGQRVTSAASGADDSTNLPFAPRYVDSRRFKGSLTLAEIADYKMALAKIKFPQAGGTVERMLPGRVLQSGEFIGDVFVDPNGLLAVYTIWFDLGRGYELTLVQEHYLRGIVDRSAEVKLKAAKNGPNQTTEPLSPGLEEATNKALVQSQGTPKSTPVEREDETTEFHSARVEPKRYSLAAWQEDAFTEMGVSLDRPTSSFVYARFKNWILIELHPIEPPPGVYDDAIWFFDVNIKRSSPASFQTAGGKQRLKTEISIEKARLSAGERKAHVFRKTLSCSNGDIISIEARVFHYANLIGKSFVEEDSAAAQRIVDSVQLIK